MVWYLFDTSSGLTRPVVIASFSGSWGNSVAGQTSKRSTERIATAVMLTDCRSIRCRQAGSVCRIRCRTTSGNGGPRNRWSARAVLKNGLSRLLSVKLLLNRARPICRTV